MAWKKNWQRWLWVPLMAGLFGGIAFVLAKDPAYWSWLWKWQWWR